VNENLPSVTIIVAARPDMTEIKAVTAALKLDYPAEKLEILVARGKQPSVQRNVALRAAKGDLIYFLDDDSVPPRDNLRRAVAAFADPVVKMAGGPNVCPPEAPLLERTFAVVLTSWLAFGPSRARYASVGKARPGSEKELILCNLVARRDVMLELGGFNEALYPNEENALMDDIQKRGGKLLYDPALLVFRRPRPNLKSFAKMLMTYGRGRAEQFRLNPTLGSAPNLVPPLFLLYLALVPWAALLVPHGVLALAPLAFYGLAVAGQALLSMKEGHGALSIAAVPLVILTHILYGFGFWRGLFTPLKAPGQRPAVPVKLEVIPH
jgi:succinoglycan biosynthesis protein ExoA